MAEQEQTNLVTKEETKQNHIQLTIEKRESIFAYNTVKDTHEELKNHAELNERDITDMLKTQKEYQQFGQWTCCGQKTLSRLSKIKSLMVTMLFCGAGLGWAYYLRDRNAELSRRTLFYTIFVSFSILCIPATGIINYVTMSLLIKATKDTWKVFYIKGIKTRLFWLELSILWFSGFWCFGRFYHYPYNENIFAAILCVLLSSSTFIVTHFFIRYTALNGYFDIFKIEARKLKTYVTMIEMMANIPKKRREFNGNSKRVKKNQKQASLHKSVRFLPQEKVEIKENNHINSNNFPETLFSIPVMNFLIDFPSTNAKQTAKKERKRKVTFNLIKEDRESIGKISAEIKKKDDKRKQKQKQIDEKKHQENNDNKTNDLGIQISETDDLEGWLKVEVTKENKQSLLLKESLNKMNILTKTDLQELLSDMYNKQYNNQSDPKSNTINQIQKYILSSGNNDIQLQYSVWKHFADKAKQFIRTPNDEDLVDVPKEEKKNTDIDDVHEILNLEYELYSINLSSNIHTVKIIDDKNLDRLTRVVSHLIFVRLKEFKQDIVDEKVDLEKLKDVTEKIKNVAEKATTYHALRASKTTDFMEQIKNELSKYDPNEIDWQTFKYMFANQDGTNKRLLKDLAFYAWIKFAPHNKKDEEKEEEEKDDEMKLIDASFISNKNTNKIEPLNVDVLNVHIFKIFKDLLLLKQSIDSYTIIITNLQKMIDVVTPLLLLFVYLSLFDVNFEDALGFYISIVGIIGFFGSSYFSSVFASLSFIMALNPFLVGDIISYDLNYYQVQEISLISCTFKHLTTGQLYTFQNKHLGESKIPIINLSRCEGSKLKYRWKLYFKHSITNTQLNKFKKRCKELISKNKFTKKEAFWSLKVRSNKCDEFQRKQINISMKYDTYNNDVNSICFNYLTQAMTEFSYQADPPKVMPHKLNIK